MTKTFRRLAFVGAPLLLLVLAAPGGCASDDTSPAPTASTPRQEQQESGLQGTVLRGPVMPGPLVGDAPDEAPFRAVFHVLDAAGDEVAQFESDDEGKFRVLLPAGDYTVVPDETAPLLRPTEQVKEVTVPAGEVAEVTLHFDTGLR